MLGCTAGAAMFVTLVGREAHEAWRADQTLLWRTTTATVLAHDVGSKAKRQFVALVTYEYEVNGQTYRCDRVRYQQPSDGAASSHSLAYARANFPIGATFEAYYDPSNPERAVLIAAEGDWGRVGWTVVAFAIAGGLIGAVVWGKRALA